MSQRLLPSWFWRWTIGLTPSGLYIIGKRLCIGIGHPRTFMPPPHRIQPGEHLPALSQRRFQRIIKPHQFNLSQRAHARKLPEVLRGFNSLVCGGFKA
jgi:hypothetical protein